MWCCVHVVWVVLYVGGVMYMSCMWSCVHVVAHTCFACGTVYLWYYVHVVQWCSIHMLLCTCCAGGFVYMWCCAHIVKVVFGTCGNGVCVGLSACQTCCVVTVSWHVYSLCCTLCGYMYCVVLYIENRRMSCVIFGVYVYEFCGVPHCVLMYIFWCTLCMYMCFILSYTWCRSMYYVVLCTMYSCMYCVVHLV